MTSLWKKPSSRLLKRKRTQNEGSQLSVTLPSDDSLSLPSGDKENAQFAENPFLKYQESIKSNDSNKKSKTSGSTEDVRSPSASSSSAPSDLRPADKLQLTSNKPFPWMTSMTAPGVAISKANIGDFNEQLLCGEKSPNNERIEEVLRAASIYHQYPDLTGISLFPRLEEHVKAAGNFRSTDDTRPLCHSPEQFFALLKSKWCESFNDLYRSWRRNRGQTSFYVFCPQFTVLFAKAKPPTEKNDGAPDLENSCWTLEDDGPRHVVIINPTLQGFRDALKQEGIDYYHVGTEEETTETGRPKLRLSGTLPSIPSAPTNFAHFNTFKDDSLNESKSPMQLVTQSQPAKLKSSPTFNLSSDEDEDEDPASDEGNDSGSADWLRDIGINSPARTFKLKRSATVGDFSQPGPNIATGATVAEETLKSAIAIWNPSSIQNFCDFFLYTQHGRLTTGPQAGLPPTLASSSAFLNSSTKSLSLSSHCVKNKTLNGQLKYILELDEGPILPHTVANITKFMQRAFNIQSRENSIDLTFSSRNFYTGFNQAMDKGTSDYSDLERCEFKCSDFSFSW